MNQNNLHPINQPRQWLAEIYLQDYPVLLYYIVRRIKDEKEAEDVLGHGIKKLIEQVDEAPDKFPARANVKALLITIIKRDSISWLRKKHPGRIDESADDIAGDDLLVADFEKYDRLRLVQPLIAELPDRLKRVIVLFFVEGCTMEQAEQRLELEKEVIRVYKSQAIKILRKKVSGKKHNLPPDQWLLLICWLYSLPQSS